MSYQSINFSEKLAKLEGHWMPGIIAELNDYQFKIVKILGDFVWHSHADTDEAFIVLEGDLKIEFRDGSVDVGPGEMHVVPRGVEHKPTAASEVKMLLIEPKGVVNTGDGEKGERTAANNVYI